MVVFMQVLIITFVFIPTVIHGGPWMGRPRPLASPAVDKVQWNLHQRFLALEPSVLQASLDVSRLAQVTTKECYRKTEEAADKLSSLAEDLNKLARRIRPVAPQCVDYKSVRKSQDYFEKAAEDVYQCTHGLSDIAASFEVEMTEKIVAARAQIMDIKQSMWFCEKFLSKVDEECLLRLESEGHQVLDKLPERARAVVDRAQAESADVLHKMGSCLMVAVSAAEERYLSKTMKVRECFQKSQGEDDVIDSSI